ncbi:helix-turn-helix domain-containing protein [Arthrobacter mobilis]|uniref:Helix-turn-helix transcriptional regulator n=1 Tax=Arthrobacter mobilis TaxID=2724944 RepID=A0A7X6HB07_9MICC|nr:helix-turn-helix transcriptional regulator [Arthrobacter mobilis]NKX53325.1 helix-turn-helix transcriptional regulator [Arthrobacter mobilis]
MAEILAMLGSLPLGLLRAAGSDEDFDEDFDELHSRGIVMLEAGPAPAAGLPDRLLAEVLRRGLPPERSRQLLGMVLDAGAWQALARTGGGTLSLARWVLDSGAGLEPAQALAAARAALDLADPALALQLAQQADGHPAAAVVRAEAHLALHDLPGAAAVLAAGEAEVAAATGAAEAEGRWLQAVLVRSRAARTQPGTAGQAARLLTAAAEGLAGTARAGCLPARLLDLEQADLALYEGRFHDISQDMLHACLHSPEPELRDRSAVLLLQVQAASGREADAQRLGRELAEASGPGESGAAAGLRERFRTQGMWDAYARLLDLRGGMAALRDGRVWIQAGIAEGLRLAEAGEPRRALELLQPALGRLQDPAGWQLLPLAASACAYAFALLENRDGVREHLDLAGASVCQGGVRLPWQAGAAARYYAGMARATVTSYSAAAAGLREDGRRAEDLGALAAALRYLSGAVRLGDVDAAPDLVRVAARVQGPFAQACGAFGSGLLRQEPPALLAAAGLAAGTGGMVFSREAARLALALASGSDTTLMRLALRYICPDAAGFDFCIGRLGGDRSLTAREQEVSARVAAGQSNADIARHFGVSVRTVEGHLYKLYARLQPRHDPVPAGPAGERMGRHA